MADTTKVKLTNTSEGPRGFWEGHACIQLDPKQSAIADLTEAEIKAAKATGYFDLGEPDDDADLSKMTVSQLKDFAEANGIDLGDAEKKADILAAIEIAVEA